MSEHFEIIDETISPQPWMQWRHVGGNYVDSVGRSYVPSSGGNKNDLVHTVEAKWENQTPLVQWVYGIVTRGGAQVTLQARSRGYLSTAHGVAISAATPPTINLIEVSRFGIGGDYGKGGVLAFGTGYAASEHRACSQSVPLMPHSTGWWRVEPGETIYAKVAVSFISEYWESTAIDGGADGTESSFLSGATRLDLYAVPAITDPGPRPVPTIVGVTTGKQITSDVAVPVPAGTTAGDALLAIAVNQWSLINDIVPAQPGWTQATARNGGANDAHMKIFLRSATATEPTSYVFENGFIAEQTVILIAVRDASEYLDDGWYFASALRKKWWNRDPGHKAPSIDRAGQLLLSVSFLAHANSQSPITQTVPSGMTSVVQVPGTASTVHVASLDVPPSPTEERMFVASKVPTWSGHSITASILIPGKKSL